MRALCSKTVFRDFFNFFPEKNLGVFYVSLYRYMSETEKTAVYSCNTCAFKTRNKTDFDRHLLTPKHEKRYIMIQKNASIDTEMKKCECGNVYKHHSGLWRHKKKCKSQECKEEDLALLGEKMTEKDLIMYLLKENKEFKELILDQSNKMMELATKPSTINNMNCNNKQQFNLNLFLNEKCKNAMNMSDFVSSLEIENDDFEDIGKLGYVQGISNIFLKGLKDLDETIRPLHCSDRKRETLYIKDNDEWNKDDNKEKIRNAIALIAHKNFKYIPIWKDANPSAMDVTTKKNDQYMRIINQVTTGITPEDDTGINKIIRNVANRVTIDRTGT